MGGGGDYYGRDVYVGIKDSRGVSSFAQEAMSRSDLDKSVLPKNRRLSTDCATPVVYALDVTGSMGTLPKLIFDKMPMIAGQIAIQRYLKDPQVSLAAIGDINSDRAPLQVCDFALIKEMDPWLKKLYIEGNGGGQHFESYEMMAYYYAYLYDMIGAKLPIFLFTGDEGFYKSLSEADLVRHFGGQHNTVEAKKVFADLKKKFQGNVFLLHRFYGGYGLDKEIVAQWQDAIGKDNIIQLPDDTAVADITLGIFALVSGRRNLRQYMEDIGSRPLEMDGKKYKPQTKERLDQVREALEPFARTLKSRKLTGLKSEVSDSGKAPNKKKPGGSKLQV